MSKSSSNLGQSAQYAFLSSLSVIFPRIVSFCLRGTLVRLAGLELLGLLFVRLELLSTTILFFSRESIRRASVGETSSSFRHSINLTWLFLPIGVLTSLICVPFWTTLTVKEELQSDYTIACWLIGLSAILQMFEEPVYFLSSKELRSKPKTVSEASMLVFRAFAYVLAAIIRPNILSFAFAHVLSSVLCALIHYFLWISDPDLPRELRSAKDLLPAKCVRSNSFFDTKQMSRMGSFYIQGVFKNILTQAERYVVTFFDVMSLSQQGLWDTVTSIGALFPRFVFKPLEEGFHLHFCQNKKDAEKDLTVILKLSIIIGLFAVAIGIPQAWSILFVYGGEQVSGEYDPSGSFFLRLFGVQDFTNSAFILQLCLVNTMACAMNGILEAYMFAVMTTEELNQHNSTLLIFSILFIFGTVTLGKMYLASGLLYAQVFNMLLRILHCCRFAALRKNSPSWLSILLQSSPCRTTLFIFCISSFLAHFSQPYIFALFSNAKLSILFHAGFGAVTLVFCAAASLFFEKDVLALLSSMGIVQTLFKYFRVFMGKNH